MGTLFVVATPIGNLGNLSPRSKETLQACALIAAEDTRHTGQMLSRVGIRVPMIILNRHKSLATHHTGPQCARQRRCGTWSVMPARRRSAIPATRSSMRACGRYPVRTVQVPPRSWPRCRFPDWRRSHSRSAVTRRGVGEQERWFRAWLGRPATLAALNSPKRVRKTVELLARIAPERRSRFGELTKVRRASRPVNNE